MSIEILGPGALDYLPCRYGTSKLLFRGPRRSLDAPYIACIGGTETYGKFIADPFPALLEKTLGIPCINFGLLNAGIDAFIHDPFVIEAAGKAELTVVQVVGAQNLSNRFYSVHPRRNDRFVAASELLKTIYSEVDFADFNFNKHLLSHLKMISPERFETVRKEVQNAWLARMRLMLSQIKGKTILLWMASDEGDPSDGEGAEPVRSLGADPLFVTREMIDQVTPMVTKVLEVRMPAEVIGADTQGMVFSELESIAAQQTPGPKAHSGAADALLPVITALRR